MILAAVGMAAGEGGGQGGQQRGVPKLKGREDIPGRKRDVDFALETPPTEPPGHPANTAFSASRYLGLSCWERAGAALLTLG